MASLSQLIVKIKGSGADGKVKAIAQIPDLLKSSVGGDKEQDKLLEDLTSLVHQTIRAPQLPVALKAIEVTGPLLESLVSKQYSLKLFVNLILPTLIDRLGDGRDRVRDASLKALIDGWRILSVGECAKDSFSLRRAKALDHFYKLMAESGFLHRSPRAREQSLAWCIGCASKDPTFPLPKFTNSVLSLAEDTHEAVRERAKTLLFDFFVGLSQDSRTSLQRALTKSTLKRTLADQLTQRILDTSKASRVGHRQTSSGSEIPPSLQCLFEGADTSREKVETPDLSSASSEASVSESRNSAHSLRSPPHQIGALSSQATDVYDSKDLQGKLLLLSKAFAGRETDHNWGMRDRELNTFRQLLRGNAAAEHAEQLSIFLKEFVANLNSTLLSLRTTLAISALNTVADLSQFLPDGVMDPYGSLIFPTLLKCASSTKKLLAETAHSVILVYLAHSSYSLKTLALLCSSVSDRSPQLRVYAGSYLVAFLTKHSAKPHQFERRGLQVGLDLVVAAVARSLRDANPKARELARQAFALLHDTWPVEAQNLLKTLDASVLKQLDPPKPSNPAKANKPALTMRPSSRLISSRPPAQPAVTLAHRSPTSLRPLLALKPNTLRRELVSRPSSVMGTSSDHKVLRHGLGTTRGIHPFFRRSPSALGPPVSRGDGYTPPCDLNSGKLAADPGLSRIPRPPSSDPQPSPVAGQLGPAQQRRTPRGRPINLLSPSSSCVPIAKPANPNLVASLRTKTMKSSSSQDKDKAPMATFSEKLVSPTEPTLTESNLKSELHKLLSLELTFSPAELRKLLRLSRELPLPDNNLAWVQSKNFSRLLRGCTNHLHATGSSDETRCAAILVLESLMKHQAALCDPYASDLLTTLIECQQSASRDVSSSAEDALKVFAQNVEPAQCINITIRYLHACLLVEKGSLPEVEDLATPTSCGFLVLTQLIPRLPRQALDTFRTDLDCLVVSGFHHSNPTVRHHVLTLVLAIQAQLSPGQAIRDFFPRLTPAQLRLVNLYLESW
ncbi:suppressor of tub2 mutation [Massospora cicadina]|nr:suppressor of tub2 mutation [Massospora cicadina]